MFPCRCFERNLEIRLHRLVSDWIIYLQRPINRAGWGIMKKNIASKAKRFLKSEDGPTAVEYAVMLSLIIVVCLTAVRSIGTRSSTTFTNVANQLGTAS